MWGEKSDIALAMGYFYFAVESKKGHFMMVISRRKWYKEIGLVKYSKFFKKSIAIY